MDQKVINRLLFILVLSLGGSSVMAETVRVAAASNFIEAANAIVDRYSAETGIQVELSPGSSGKLYAQIKHGAPFDLFLSADQEKPKRLVEDGLALKESLVTYAKGRLVLLGNNQILPFQGEATLASPELTRLAIANPKLAPYGAAAVSYLNKVAQLTKTKSAWVMGENISQTFQFVFTGNAQLAIVAHSQLHAIANDERFSYLILPEKMHSPIRQDMVLLLSGPNKHGAKSLWHFVQSESARNIIKGFGYGL